MGESGGEILEVEGRQFVGGDGIELDFVAGRDAEQANLFGGIFDTDQADRLLKGERAGGDLRPDEQGERAGLRRAEVDAQLSGVGVETPERDERGGPAGGGGIEDIGDRRAGGDIEDEFGEFALGGADDNVVRAVYRTGGWDIELVDLGVEDRLRAESMTSRLRGFQAIHGLAAGERTSFATVLLPEAERWTDTAWGD